MKTVNMSSVFCVGCHLPHSVNDDKLCEFCRRVPVAIERQHQRQRDAHVLMLAILIVAIVSGAFWYADVVMRGAK